MEATRVLPFDAPAADAPAAPRAPAPRPPKRAVFRKWLTGMVCGVASLATCCCCFCGGCGSVPAPAVLYDEDEFDFGAMQAGEARCIHAVQWCGLAGLAVRCLPSCGLCCGCCGNVTPKEAVMCAAAMDESKRARR